jgi:hypothetical protein
MKHLCNQLLRIILLSITFTSLGIFTFPASSYAATAPTGAHISAVATKTVTLQEGLVLGVVKPVYGHREQTLQSSRVAVKPNTTTVLCWLPHDAEVTNKDATWCLYGSGTVAIYNVFYIYNANSSSWVFFGINNGGGYNLAPGVGLSVSIAKVRCISVGGLC